MYTGALLAVQNITLSVTEEMENTTIDVCIVLDARGGLERDVEIQPYLTHVTTSKDYMRFREAHNKL